ncbi:signal peptidase II [Eilatimonas milleporae]|uniref:signal peptidase II n=1 Tax=Eilatimonas milleporae TaxID=911205 RepID=UPI000EFA04AB
MVSIGSHTRLGLGCAVLVLVLDQISKWWVLAILHLPEKGSVAVLPFLNFTMVWNRGISLGLPLENLIGRWGLVLLTVAIVAWLGHWLMRAASRLEAIALAGVMGGAVGNLIDRFIHGAVVDFIHLHALGRSFYVFNVADSAITVSVVLLVLDGLRSRGKTATDIPDGLQDSDTGPKKGPDY